MMFILYASLSQSSLIRSWLTLLTIHSAKHLSSSIKSGHHFWQLNCDMILIPYQIWASLKTAAGMEVTFKGLYDHMYFA